MKYFGFVPTFLSFLSLFGINASALNDVTSMKDFFKLIGNHQLNSGEILFLDNHSDYVNFIANSFDFDVLSCFNDAFLMENIYLGLEHLDLLSISRILAPFDQPIEK
jgi:hypothetical protein